MVDDAVILDQVNDALKKVIDPHMSVNLDEMGQHIADLKENYETTDEVCLDEIAADKAAYKAIREICLDALLDVEPKGEA